MKLIYTILILTLLTVSCRKTDVKVHRKNNDIEFKLISKFGDMQGFSVGYTSDYGITSYEFAQFFTNGSKSWKCKLSKHDDYYFSVTPYNNGDFEMQMLVNGKIYKNIIMNGSNVDDFNYVISGNLKTKKE